MKLYSDSIKDAAKKLCSELTLREKIGQMIQFNGRALRQLKKIYSDEEIAEKFPIGSFFCGDEVIDKSGRKLLPTAALGELRNMFKLPLLIAGDLECGVDGKFMPNHVTLGGTDDPALAYEFGKVLAQEGFNHGYHWTYGPIVDLTETLLSLPGVRSLGSDPERVAVMAESLIKGIQDQGFCATAKHFPGEGPHPVVNPHLTAYVNDTDRETWMATVGKVFRRAIDAGAKSIMTTHIGLSCFDESGLPATLSGKLTTDLIRGVLNFEGVVVTDALEMGGFVSFRDYEKRMIATVNAGSDVLLWPEIDIFDLLEKAVADGRIKEERITESALRVLEMKFGCGLLGDHKMVIPPPPGNRFDEVAREVAEKGTSIVSDSQKYLPLKIKPGSKILVAVVDDPLLLHGADLRQYAPIRHVLDELEARGAELTLMDNPNCLTIRTMEQNNIQWDCVIALVAQQPLYQTRLSGWCCEVLWLMNHCQHTKVVVISLDNPYIHLENPGTAAAIINACSNCKASQIAAVKVLCGEIPGAKKFPFDCKADTRPFDAWDKLKI